MLARSKPPANTDAVRSSRPFVVGQQVVGPLDGMAQRELTLRTWCCARCNRRNRSASRSLTSIALIAAIRAAASSIPSGSPSTVVADLRHRRRSLRVLELEVVADRAGPLDEQGDGIGGHAAFGSPAETRW